MARALALVEMIASRDACSGGRCKRQRHSYRRRKVFDLICGRDRSNRSVLAAHRCATLVCRCVQAGRALSGNRISHGTCNCSAYSRGSTPPMRACSPSGKPRAPMSMTSHSPRVGGLRSSVEKTFPTRVQYHCLCGIGSTRSGRRHRDRHRRSQQNRAGPIDSIGGGSSSSRSDCCSSSGCVPRAVHAARVQPNEAGACRGSRLPTSFKAAAKMRAIAVSDELTCTLHWPIHLLADEVDELDVSRQNRLLAVHELRQARR